MQHGRSISSVNGSISTILSLAEINICTRCTLVRSSRVFSLCTLPLHTCNRGANDQRRRQLDAPWPTRRASRVIWASIRVSDTNQLDGESGVWRFLGALGQPLGCAKTLSTPTSLTLIGTNYVMWWPYNNDGQAVAGEQSILFRYTLAFD